MNNLPSSPALLVVRGGACSLALDVARPFPGFPPSPTQRPPNARQIGPTKWPGTNSKLCARRRRRRLQCATAGRTRARCSLERDAKMGSTWSAGQNAGPMAAAGPAPRPTGGARGVKRRSRRDGLRRRGRRIGGQAQRPPPRPTWSAFDDFACPPLLPSRSSAATGRADTSERAGWIAGWREAAAATSKRSKLL